MDNLILERLLNLQLVAKEKAKNFPKKRFAFESILNETNTNIITGISGLRGAGKTVLLSQLLEKIPHSFYIPCDAVEHLNLFETAEYLSQNNHISTLLLDEIHFNKNWAKDLKMLYDFGKMKIFFTSSVSLNILNTAHDLARRVKIIDLPIFGFSEFLKFKHNIITPKLQLEEIVHNYKVLWKKHQDKEIYFQEYLSAPIPFMLTAASIELVKQIINKIIEKDLFFMDVFTSEDIYVMRNVMNFIANAPIAEVNYSVLSQNLSITKYKAKQYVEFLEKGYLLKSVFPYSSNVIKEPKIILSIPMRTALNYRLNEEQIKGALREEFFVSTIGKVSNFFYLKSRIGKKTPDYLILSKDKKLIFEIGGRKKGFSQFKGIKKGEAEKFVVTYPGTSQNRKIPLILFGFLA